MGFFSRDTSRDAAIQQDFLRLAEQLGMEVEGVFPSLTLIGTEPGFTYKFRQYESEYIHEVDGRRETRKIWYAGAAVQDREWLRDLFVDEEHLLNRIVQFFGAHDIKLGNAEFDAAFTIKCSDEAYARKLLTPAAQAALLAQRQHKPLVHIINGEVVCEYGGFVDDAGIAARMLNDLLSVARALGR